MGQVLNALGWLLGWLMYGCYELINNYGIAIIVFTFLTKIILMPVSIWVQKNSIKLVKMSPQINRIKAKNFGNGERISELQYELYKKEHYSPLADIIPLFIQIVLLMGVVDVIYRPLSHILRLSKDTINGLVSTFSAASGTDAAVSSIQVGVVKAVAGGTYPGVFEKVADASILDKIAGLKMTFLGIDLTEVPFGHMDNAMLIPILAALSALLLCYVQNRINVLQVEQGKLNRYGTTAVSVGLSLYLGLFVPTGIGLYWVFSNLFAIVQLYLLNVIIDPKKHIDYAELEESKKELQKAADAAPKRRKWFEKDPYGKKEREDCRRFYHTYDKNLVFYAERNGFYKYFQGIIEIILNETKIPVHYVTSDPNDAVFSIHHERFFTYYVGDMKLIPFMMKMDADVIAMTTPDLEQFQIKRSYLRKDAEYIYIPHSVNSENLTLRTGALDYYDTVFAVGPQYETDIREMEELRKTKKKTLVKWGSGVMDSMISSYASIAEKPETPGQVKTVLIAPSWQEDNIMDLCIEELLEKITGKGYRVVLRPHPQYIRHFEEKVNALAKRYNSREDVLIQKDFSSNETVYSADILITDWSSISFEYAFSTLQPVLFINTPMKVMNPDYKLIENTPIDIAIREQVGRSVDVDQLDSVFDVLKDLMEHKSDYKEKIRAIRQESIYNIGSSSQAGAQYLIDRVKYYDKKRMDEGY